MGKNDLNIDIEGNLIDEEKEYQRLIELSFFRGQKVVLQNMLNFINEDLENITPKNRTMSNDNIMILKGIELAYNKLSILINDSIDIINFEVETKDKTITRGNG
ncbi:hypothetical protein EOM09_04195 [bacterium]|nr:hypothetical protein [bacterium]